MESTTFLGITAVKATHDCTVAGGGMDHGATSLAFEGETAIITLLGGGGGSGGRLPWGTPAKEHRLNPWLVGSLQRRLDFRHFLRGPVRFPLVLHA